MKKKNCSHCKKDFLYDRRNEHSGKRKYCGQICMGLARRMTRDLSYLYKIFLDRINRTDSCWDWTSTKDKDGYGIISFNGKMYKAHRISWEYHNGPIPKGMLVLHRCDRPMCCSPLHIFLGTAKDNYQDMVNKGRRRLATGERVFGTKINTETAIKIKELLNKGVLQVEICKILNTSRAVVQSIKLGKTWKHI